MTFYMKPSQQQRSPSGPFCSRACVHASLRGGFGDAAAQFFAQVDCAGPIPEQAPDLGACWVWMGRRNKAGYGVLGVNQRDGYRPGSRLATRFIMEALTGYLRPDALVCHRCDNPPCVNPAHLYIGDATTNAADTRRRGRTARGTAIAAARLNPEAVRALRRLREVGWSLARLADAFGVSRHAVTAVLAGSTWGHVR
jgi:hypothetical protein